MKYLLIYLLIINVLGFIIMGYDKQMAKKNKWRVPEKTLFAFCIIGGSIGTILGMYLWHHKTKHWYFVFGMPAILVIQIVLAVLYFVYH